MFESHSACSNQVIKAILLHPEKFKNLIAEIDLPSNTISNSITYLYRHFCLPCLETQELPLILHGDIVLDRNARQVMMGEKFIRLTRREFDVLCVLLERQGRVVLHHELLQAVYWHASNEVDSNVLQAYVCALRKKLGKKLISTVRGEGYTICKSS